MSYERELNKRLYGNDSRLPETSINYHRKVKMFLSNINYHCITKNGKVKMFLSKESKGKDVINLIEQVTYFQGRITDCSLHKFYHNEFLVGCMLCSCGYDRTPKRQDYIEKILDKLLTIDGIEAELERSSIHKLQSIMNKLDKFTKE